MQFAYQCPLRGFVSETLRHTAPTFRMVSMPPQRPRICGLGVNSSEHSKPNNTTAEASYLQIRVPVQSAYQCHHRGLISADGWSMGSDNASAEASYLQIDVSQQSA